MSAVLELTRELIRRASVTPDDHGCQALLGERLSRAGFAVETLRYGEVSNLWATHGSTGSVLVFLGHTDVVPTGPEAAWSSPPFEPTLRGSFYSTLLCFYEALAVLIAPDQIAHVLARRAVTAGIDARVDERLQFIRQRHVHRRH